MKLTTKKEDISVTQMQPRMIGAASNQCTKPEIR